MERYKIPLVNGSGRTIGYGDRWWTHRVSGGRDGPILGQKHVGITISIADDDGRILVQHRRHKIFDKVWSLSGDTHPRKYESSKVESLSEAARRCAKEDLGVVIKSWRQILTVSYSARDPRDPRYCENELLYILAAKHGGPVNMNRNSAYELRWPSLQRFRGTHKQTRKRRRLTASTHPGSTVWSPSRTKGLKKPFTSRRRSRQENTVEMPERGSFLQGSSKCSNCCFDSYYWPDSPAYTSPLGGW